MALRNQPYIPLYIQDIMTDEKLNECSAATHGIYIKGIMCLMHKSETYGKILLKQKYKQTSSTEKNFALQLLKHLPYSLIEIETALTELIRENVCHYDGDFLCQRRMIKDNSISEARAKAGEKGGKAAQDKEKKFAKAKPKAKPKANSESESESISFIVYNNYNEKFGEKFFSVWETLCKTKKWKEKEMSALELAFKKLKKYPEEFAITLMEAAIMGGYQGIVFRDTEKQFSEWQKGKDNQAQQGKLSLNSFI